MSDKFDLFRLSLLPREQRDIETHPDPSREDYLRELFSEDWKFTRSGINFHYVSQSLEEDEKRSEIIGRIGRSIVIEENLSPSDNFEDSEHKTWKAAVIVIDPTHHQDGQKVSIEADSKVGRTDTIMKGLVDSINEKNPHTAYHLEVVPILEASTFWQFAEENSGKITTLTFTFVAPNMFGGHDNITEEMRRYRDEEKAQKVKISMSSGDSIDATTDNVKNSVEYITKGGGEITARAKGGNTYNSNKETIHVTLDDDTDDPILVKVARHISKVLGRE